MEKDLLKVFNIMLMLKNFRKEPYVIDSEDAFIIYNYWKVYGLNKYMTLKKFRNAVITYSVASGNTLHASCEELCKKIKFEK